MKQLVRNITDETMFKQVEGFDITDIDGEMVMMDLLKGEYFMFNDVSSRIWDMAKEPISIKNIVEKLQEEYEVDEVTCHDQVIELVERLGKLELISISE